MTPRRALNLIRGFQQGSHTWSSMAGLGLKGIGYTMDRELLYRTVDALALLTVATIAPHSKRKPKVPDPTPRPGMEGKQQAKPARSLKARDMPGAVPLGR